MRICDRHEKQVPLIWTFAFSGAEYWCPHCGANFGMMRAGKEVENTPELLAANESYKKLSNDYLNAMSTFACDSLVFEGKKISRDDLPQREFDRCQKVIDDWKYET